MALWVFVFLPLLSLLVQGTPLFLPRGKLYSSLSSWIIDVPCKLNDLNKEYDQLEIQKDKLITGLITSSQQVLKGVNQQKHMQVLINMNFETIHEMSMQIL